VKVVSFSYPFGDRSLKQCGWYATLTCNWRAPADLVRYDRPMIVFDLPRFWVSNWNGEELNAKLREYS